MKSGVIAGVLALVAVLSCGNDGREFGTGGGAGTAAQGGDDSAGSGGSAGSSSVDEAGGGSGGQNPPDGDAGAGAAADPGEDLCVGKVCDSPPAGECLSGTEFQTYDQIGSCDAGACSYTPHVIPCTCEGEACTTDPCIGLTCDAPPSAICKDASTLTEYAESGTCSAGSCSYAATDTPCPFGCANGACKADSCANLTCNTPPGSTCKDAGTRTTYASTGTCSDGTCSYAATNTACAGATAKCKDLGASSKCVACLANSDCSNGGTCNASGACVCSARFNGARCEFQVFRGIGTLAGDLSSRTRNISHDGKVVVGGSFRSDGFEHAVRSVNGAPLEFIAEPASLTPSTGCRADAVDSSGAVLLYCEGGATFLHTNAGGDVAIDGGTAVDISLDGKVIIGVGVGSPTQGFRKVGSVTTPLGGLHAGGSSMVFATNGDGSVVVGDASLAGGGRAATRWTAALGLLALPKLVNWYSPIARDVSTDGKVIVGHTKDPADTVAVKWSGADLSPSVLGPGQALCTNGDGRVIGGYSYSSDASWVATIWDSAGVQRTVKDLLGATPDLTSDWTLGHVVGISDDGKFLVGNGTHGTKSEGWVAHLP